MTCRWGRLWPSTTSVGGWTAWGLLALGGVVMTRYWWWSAYFVAYSDVGGHVHRLFYNSAFWESMLLGVGDGGLMPMILGRLYQAGVNPWAVVPFMGWGLALLTGWWLWRWASTMGLVLWLGGPSLAPLLSGMGMAWGWDPAMLSMPYLGLSISRPGVLMALPVGVWLLQWARSRSGYEKGDGLASLRGALKTDGLALGLLILLVWLHLPSALVLLSALAVMRWPMPTAWAWVWGGGFFAALIWLQFGWGGPALIHVHGLIPNGDWFMGLVVYGVLALTVGLAMGSALWRQWQVAGPIRFLSRLSSLSRVSIPTRCFVLGVCWLVAGNGLAPFGQVLDQLVWCFWAMVLMAPAIRDWLLEHEGPWMEPKLAMLWLAGGAVVWAGQIFAPQTDHRVLVMPDVRQACSAVQSVAWDAMPVLSPWASFHPLRVGRLQQPLVLVLWPVWVQMMPLETVAVLPMPLQWSSRFTSASGPVLWWQPARDPSPYPPGLLLGRTKAGSLWQVTAAEVKREINPEARHQW